MGVVNDRLYLDALLAVLEWLIGSCGLAVVAGLMLFIWRRDRSC